MVQKRTEILTPIQFRIFHARFCRPKNGALKINVLQQLFYIRVKGPSHVKGRTQAEGVSEQGTEEGIWA